MTLKARKMTEIRKEKQYFFQTHSLEVFQRLGEEGRQPLGYFPARSIVQKIGRG